LKPYYLKLVPLSNAYQCLPLTIANNITSGLLEKHDRQKINPVNIIDSPYYRSAQIVVH
jgi:hypothetical protein